jgi:hypothetical protein
MMGIRGRAAYLTALLLCLSPSVASADLILGPLDVAGDYSIVDPGSITQAGRLSISGSATFTAGGDILLADASNLFWSVDATSSGNRTISLADADGMLVSADAGTGNVTLVSGGALTIGDLTGNAVSATGAAGLFNTGAITARIATFDGNFTQSGSGSLHATLAGASTGSVYRFIGNVTLGGRLEVSLAGGLLPNPGDVFDVLDWTGALNGSFLAVNLPDGVWDTSRLLTAGEIEFVQGTVLDASSTALLLVCGLTALAGVTRRAKAGRHEFGTDSSSGGLL